jgi:hypothetical protein
LWFFPNPNEGLPNPPPQEETWEKIAKIPATKTGSETFPCFDNAPLIPSCVFSPERLKSGI